MTVPDSVIARNAKKTIPMLCDIIDGWEKKCASQAQQIAQLREALQAEFDSQVCTCKFLGYLGEEPPCKTCKLAALLQNRAPEVKHEG
jgi:hypothetical protein